MDNTLAGNPVRDLARSLTNIADYLSGHECAPSNDADREMAAAFRQLAVMGCLIADKLDSLADQPGREFEDTRTRCLMPWLDVTDLAVQLAGTSLDRSFR